MHRVILSLILIASLLPGSFTAAAQSGIDFIDIAQEWKFGEQVRFSGVIESSAPITKTVLFIHPYGADTRLSEVKVNQDGKITYTIDLAENPLRAFTPVEYWYQVSLETGQEITSPVYTFLYEDNRFDWQRIDANNFSIAWVAGDLTFGQMLQNAAEDGLAAAQAILPVDPPTPLRVYVYPSAQEMQSAITLASLPWAAGHASPDIGIILISIPEGPDARAEMERQLPHEIMHMLEYQVIGAAYNRAPTWLLEGLASAAELYPNPEYQRVLENAVESDTLIPMTVLCQEFPRDLSGAILAYAQSNSFVRFLHQSYGSSGITTLLNAYSDGLNCEAGVQTALGSSLSEIETRWQMESLGHNATLAAWKQLLPYLLLAFLVLVPLGLTLFPKKPKKSRQEQTGQ